jgi:hypothetical protein
MVSMMLFEAILPIVFNRKTPEKVNAIVFIVLAPIEIFIIFDFTATTLNSNRLIKTETTSNIYISDSEFNLPPQTIE